MVALEALEADDRGCIDEGRLLATEDRHPVRAERWFTVGLITSKEELADS